MDTLKEIIQTMDKVQQKEFVYFIQRNKYRKGRKDLSLFNVLKNEREYKPIEIQKFTGSTNSNAYHTLRKRLFRHLADFCILKSMSDDAGSLSHVNGIVGIVNYLFDKNLSTLGWKYLLVGETIALQNNYHTILNAIYLLQIEKVHLQNELSLNDIIKRYKENQQMLIHEEKLQIASSIIRQKLIANKAKGNIQNFQALITSTLSQLNIDESVLQTPTITLSFIKIIRAGIIANKDFHSFEPYLIKTYHSLYKKKGPVNYMVKSELLYTIAHTSYRNKKFTQSLKYLDELNSSLKECGKSFQKKFYGKQALLISANLIFLKELKKATENIHHLYNERNILSNEDQFNTIVNMGIYAFFNKEYKKSHGLLTKLSHSDNWYKKNMGVEWVLKKSLMEILLYAELKYFDLVESRIKSVERNYSMLRSHPIYKKAFDYLKLIKDYLFKFNMDLQGREEEFLNQLDFLPYEHEDIQAMAFYAWLKSKVTKKDFYETLLSLFKY